MSCFPRLRPPDNKYLDAGQAAGNPIGGAPTATGQVNTGERVSWPVTAGTLTNGTTYQWYMETCDQGVCSAPQVFTVNTAGAPPPPVATATATITGKPIRVGPRPVCLLITPGTKPHARNRDPVATSSGNTPRGGRWTTEFGAC